MAGVEPATTAFRWCTKLCPLSYIRALLLLLLYSFCGIISGPNIPISLTSKNATFDNRPATIRIFQGSAIFTECFKKICFCHGYCFLRIWTMTLSPGLNPSGTANSVVARSSHSCAYGASPPSSSR